MSSPPTSPLAAPSVRGRWSTRAGRTNREISRELYLSVNTVETHLAHACRKLSIGRRSELAGQELD